jgi:hypothetical protein
MATDESTRNELPELRVVMPTSFLAEHATIGEQTGNTSCFSLGEPLYFS